MIKAVQKFSDELEKMCYGSFARMRCKEGREGPGSVSNGDAFIPPRGLGAVIKLAEVHSVNLLKNGRYENLTGIV